MYFNTDPQNKLNFLKFLSTKNQKPLILKEYTYTNISELNVTTKTVLAVTADILKKKFFLEFIFALLTLNVKVNINYATPSLPSTFKNKFNFYSGIITSNLTNYISKNNFINLQITNISFYSSLKKYSAIFTKNEKNININKFFATNMAEVFQEITEIKPDKAKKIYFKKKQVKTFTYTNEANKNYTYIDVDSIEQNNLEKDIFFKNIFMSSVVNKSNEMVLYSTNELISNKSVGFWKKPQGLTLKSGLILNNYVVNKCDTKYTYQLRNFFKNSIDAESSLLDFSSSINFTDFAVAKTERLEFYKNIFLYNFINLFSKTSSINYAQKYTYFNHVPEFKDYFFKKNNPLSRDLVVHNTKNKNKFNNFFPLYCLSFKKFKKLILFSKKQQSPAYSAYYMYYLVNFLELMCKKKIWIRINTKKQITDEVYNKFIALFMKNRADQVNIGKHFFLIEFYEIIYLSFINRDINFFAMWFKKIMEKIHLKKHRKMVKVIHSTIRNNLLFLELTGIKGFSMDVRGKLGTAGNSKKKHYAFNVGSIAPTTKSHGLNLHQTTVRTSTGVLGVTILMSY